MKLYLSGFKRRGCESQIDEEFYNCLL